MSKPRSIKDPVTKKTHSISREAATALERLVKAGEAEQKKKAEEAKAKAELLQGKRYSGKTKDLEIAVKFNKEGKIDQFKDPQWELSGQMASLSPEMKKVVNDAILQTMICMNEAQEQRDTELNDQVVKPMFKQEQEVA